MIIKLTDNHTEVACNVNYLVLKYGNTTYFRPACGRFSRLVLRGMSLGGGFGKFTRKN